MEVNIYDNTTMQICFGNIKNGLFFGISEYVYENEGGEIRAF